ncbi:MAG: SLC26A/SulP transporter family protein [Magnetococcales bacterium]|nr:SLC26A/SulP transporter family protein [Magnetococcales bacterium]
MHLKSATWTGDAWGGLAGMLVALPSAIAYGVAAITPLGSPFFPLGAMAGVMGVVAMGLSTPAIGGAPRLITAPCAPAAAVLSALISERLAAGGYSPEQILLFLTMVALFSSLLQILYGGIGGGRIIKYIPYPVVTGYLSGVGLIILLSQIPKLLGLPKDASPWRGLIHPDSWQMTSLLVGVATMIGMVVAPKITRQIPAPIIGLLLGMGIYFLSGMTHPELLRLDGNPLLIGVINIDLASLAQGFQGRWQALEQLRLADLSALVLPALTLSALLSIDTLKTCVVVDTLTRSRHQSNRELMAQGTGNFLSALVGGMPGAGTMGATLVSIHSGGQTRFAGILEGLFSLVVLLFFSSLLGWVPIAALSGILMVVAWRMIDWHSLSLVKQRDTLLDFFVVITVVATAVSLNLVAAAGAGVTLAVALFLRDQIKTPVIRRKLSGGQYSSKRNRIPEERALLEQHKNTIIICELQGNLFFGTTDQLYTRLEPDFHRTRYLIFDLSRVQSIDFTAAHMISQIDTMLFENGSHLLLAEPSLAISPGRDPTIYLNHLGLTPSSHLQIFLELEEAVEWVEDQILANDTHNFHNDERPLALQDFPLFKGFEHKQKLDVLDFLAKVVVERSCKSGEVLFRHGDQGDEMYFIRCGSVRIAMTSEDGNNHTVAIFGRGGFFGDMAFIDHAPRSSHAVTIRDTDLFILSRGVFDVVSTKDPHLASHVFARLCKELTLRLRFADAEIMALKNA